MEIIAALIVGLIIGAGACWAVMRSRATIAPETREQIKDAVQASAAQAFQENNTSFLNLASERLNGTMEAAKGELNQRHEQFNTTMEAAKGEFKQRHEQFQELVKPLAENYQSLNPPDKDPERSDQPVGRRPVEQPGDRKLGRGPAAPRRGAGRHDRLL